METLVEQVCQALIDSIDPKVLASSHRYFKESEAAKVHGVRMSEVSKIGKASLQQIKDLPKEKVFEFCEELWKTGYLEESVIACIWAESLHKEYKTADFKIFEYWVHNYLTNWALRYFM